MAHIEKRALKDGTTIYKVCWRDPDSKQKDSLTFDDEAKAERLKKLLNANGQRLADAQRVAQAIINNIPTVADIIEHHIEHLTGVTARTKRDYRRDARNHITPHLGGIPIDALTKDRVKQWVNHLVAPDEEDTKPISPKTLRNVVYSVLSPALNSAIPEYRADNPAKGIRMPQEDPVEMIFLTHGEFSLLQSHIPEEHRTFLRFLVSTGLRWSEAIVLTVDDFDLLSNPGTVRVSKARKRGPNGPYTGPPKSKRARRTVSLAPSIVPELAALTIDKAGDDLMFTTGHGGMYHAGNFRERVWLRALEKANAEKDPDGHPIPRALRLNKRPRVHDLRHTHASWQVAAGVDLPTVQRRLGHESIKTTVDRYGHLLPDQIRRSAEAADLGLANTVTTEHSGAST
ncbi:site-specific recombinase XerD [Prauserella sp. Am3]|nr:site-specific recombinase XerD [Prauserella sp. Am3]